MSATRPVPGRCLRWELAWFLWSVANTLTVAFIAKGVEAAGGTLDVERETIVLLIGAVIWSYLGIIFEILTETVAWERWEGTIEYTFMAPLSRPAHLFGMGIFAVLYGVVSTALLFRRLLLRPQLSQRELRLCVPLGLWVFSTGERYAKRHGRLKRSG